LPEIAQRKSTPKNFLQKTLEFDDQYPYFGDLLSFASLLFEADVPPLKGLKAALSATFEGCHRRGLLMESSEFSITLIKTGVSVMVTPDVRVKRLRGKMLRVKQDRLMTHIL